MANISYAEGVIIFAAPNEANTTCSLHWNT